MAASSTTGNHTSLTNAPRSLPISQLKFIAESGTHVDDEKLKKCAALFSQHYGVWGAGAKEISNYTKPGERIKMSWTKLRSQCVTVPERTVLVTCYHQDTELAGHAFAATWEYENGTVGWITQLVVKDNMRKRYIATQLLQTLKSHPLFQSITAIGLVSSHPAACSVLAKYSGLKVNALDLKYISNNAKQALVASPIHYLQTAQLRGSLFEDNPSTRGLISSAYTQYFVDHEEPLRALQAFREADGWCLGELRDGHEFLILVPVKISG